MTSPAKKAGCGAVALLIGTALLSGTPALAQRAQLPPGAVVQPLPNAGTGAELRGHLRTLADNPRSLSALVGAGRAALALHDYQAALTFFARAQEVAPSDPRVLAGMGSVLIHLEQPQDALRYFAQATAAGAPQAEIASDRGLAYDAIGDQARAQADYNLALRTRDDPEVQRRLALSLAIAGQREPALRTIANQVARGDRAALRVRTFVLALTGDPAGAGQAARSAMPAGAAATLTPFLSRLPNLTPAQRAMAVHFGRFPAGGGMQMAGTPQGQPYTPPAAVQQVQRPPPRQQTQTPQARQQPQTTTRRSDAAATPQPATRQPSQTQAAPAEARRRERRPVDFSDRFGLSLPEQTATRRRQTTSPQAQQPTAPPARQPAPAPQPATPSTQQPAGTAPATTAQQQPVQTTQAPLQAWVPAQAPPAVTQQQQIQTAEATPQQQPIVSAPTPVGAPVTEPSPASVPASTQPSQSPVTGPVEAPLPGFTLQPGVEARPLAQAPVQPPVTTEQQAPTPAPAQPASRPGFDEVAALVSRLPTEERVAPSPAPTPQSSTQQQAAAPAPRRTERTAAAAPTPRPSPPAAATQRPAPRIERAPSPTPANTAARNRTAAAETPVAANRAQQPPRETHPSRHWVQVAGGADRATLPREFARLREQAPVLFRNRTPYVTPLRATNRLLVGPFPSVEAAQEFVNQLARQNLTAFAWTSPAGQEIERLAAR